MVDVNYEHFEERNRETEAKAKIDEHFYMEGFEREAMEKYVKRSLARGRSVRVHEHNSTAKCNTNCTDYLQGT